MELIEIAIDYARRKGAQFADIRVIKKQQERIFIRNTSVKEAATNESYGYGIRTLYGGAWGFAHCNVFEQDQLIKTVDRALVIAKESARLIDGRGLVLSDEPSYYNATYTTPVEIDPFDIAIEEKIETLLEINRQMQAFAPIALATSLLVCVKEHKLYGNSDGTRLDINTTYIEPMITATAVADGDSQSRSFREGGHACGWEWFEKQNLPEQAPRIAEQAIMKVKADTLSESRPRQLLLDPLNMSLTIHESVGHPTELDRVLGWEADMAGTTFATPDKLGSYRYGSEPVNLIADNTLESGLAGAGFDDDGVANQKWHIIKEGILQEYGSTRATAPLLGLSRSRGCNRAANYHDFPINRIPNLYLAAGKEPLTPGELINDTKDGIYIEGQGSFSIDQHRVNFQFGGDMFWEIKNGKKTRPLKKVIYRSSNPHFWGNVDAICDQRFFKTYGITNCGKGQPSQSGRMTHGGALTRFQNIFVGSGQ